MTAMITCDEFIAKLNDKGGKIQILDVRTKEEKKQSALACDCACVPLHRLARENMDGLKKDEPLYILCKAGGRAAAAASYLAGLGFEKPVVIQGGLTALKERGAPVTEAAGKQPMSIERQVRITAGVLVLAGVLGGALISPYLYILSGLIGAGLVFAGITNYCGMAVLLARMPWNGDKTALAIQKSMQEFQTTCLK